MTTDPALDALETRSIAYARRTAAVFPANKAAVFAALATAGITVVTVSFDGYGDEGAIQNVESRAGDTEIALPDVAVEVLAPSYASDEPHRGALALSEAVEAIVYDVLGQTHAGWQDGDGAYGEVTFDVAGALITLDHNARFTASESFTHEF